MLTLFSSLPRILKKKSSLAIILPPTLLCIYIHFGVPSQFSWDPHDTIRTDILKSYRTFTAFRILSQAFSPREHQWGLSYTAKPWLVLSEWLIQGEYDVSTSDTSP